VYPRASALHYYSVWQNAPNSHFSRPFTPSIVTTAYGYLHGHINTSWQGVWTNMSHIKPPQKCSYVTTYVASATSCRTIITPDIPDIIKMAAGIRVEQRRWYLVFSNNGIRYNRPHFNGVKYSGFQTSEELPTLESWDRKILTWRLKAGMIEPEETR
jgi:hypothetical protein